MNVSVGLTNSQLKKISKDIPVQLKNSNLIDFANKHVVGLNVSKQLASKINRAINNGSGVRIPKGDVHVYGGSLISSALKLTKSVPVSFVRKAMGGSILDKITHQITKKVVPKPYQKIADLAVNHVVNEAINSGGKLGMIGTIAKNVNKKYVPKEYRKIADLAIDASGSGMKPLKGSPEMKAKMQALRNRRNGVSNEGSGMTWKKFVSPPKSKNNIAGRTTNGLQTAAPIWDKMAKTALPMLGLGMEQPVKKRGRPRKDVEGGSFKGGSFKGPNSGTGLANNLSPGPIVKPYLKRGNGFLM